MKEPNADLEHFKQDPRAARLLGDRQALRQLLSSPDTQRLVELLRQQSGGGLDTAASSAARGDTQALTGLVHQLMDSQEGAALVRRIRDQMPGEPKTP